MANKEPIEVRTRQESFSGNEWKYIAFALVVLPFIYVVVLVLTGN